MARINRRNGTSGIFHKRVIQRHHISYMPEKEVSLFKGEHYVITLLGRMGMVSRQFLECLEVWVGEKGKEAIDLEKEGNNGKQADS